MHYLANIIYQISRKVSKIKHFKFNQQALNKIHYIETYKRNLLLHTDEGEVISYESMKALEQRLSPFGFYRCHAGYLVNMGLVRKVEKLEITLSSGETVYVSKPKKKDFMKALAGYWGKML